MIDKIYGSNDYTCLVGCDNASCRKNFLADDLESAYALMQEFGWQVKHGRDELHYCKECVEELKE